MDMELGIILTIAIGIILYCLLQGVRDLNKPNRKASLKRFMVDNNITYKLETPADLVNVELKRYHFSRGDEELFTIQTWILSDNVNALINEDIRKVSYDYAVELTREPELLLEIIKESTNIEEV